MDTKRGTVTTNGLEFGYLEQGEGPLVLLLHGFPDDAHTWARQLPALADAGYRAVAPFMRGYPPTGAAPDGRYDAEVLAADVAGLAEALGDGGPAYVVGHDWGAIATYASMAMHPQAVERAAVIAVGHPSTFASALLDPALAHHIFHTWLFQLGDLAVAALTANDMALVDYLWNLWTPGGHHDDEHVARVKRETLGAPGAAEAAVAYYPGLVTLPTERPDAAERLMQPTTVPTLVIFGAEDPARVEVEEAQFTGGVRYESVAGAGHFVHRDRPDDVSRLLLDWLRGSEGTARPGAAEATAAG